jgi:hypothetical protein
VGHELRSVVAADVLRNAVHREERKGASHQI